MEVARLNIKIDEGVAFTVAYTAMLHAGRAWVLFKGFRPADGSQHETVVDFMFYAFGKGYKSLIVRFDKMRRKRNTFTYEVTILISSTEAKKALATATQFIKIIKKFIKQANPQVEFNF